MKIRVSCALSLALLCGAHSILSAQPASPGQDSVPPNGNAASAAVDQTLKLLDAMAAGDQSGQAKLTALVAAVTQDARVSDHEKFVIASRARDLGIHNTQGLTPARRLQAYEQSARAMIAAYPGERAPYEAFLALANDQADGPTGGGLARELLTMRAPADVKAGAQTLLDRLAMVGKPLSATVQQSIDLPFDIASYRGKVVVLYAWTGVGASSYQWVRGLLQLGGSDIVFLGFNFDRDRNDALAKSIEVAAGAPQFFDPAGLDGLLARRLHFSRVPCIYLIDRAGVVRSVTVWRNLPQEIAQLVAEKGGQS